MNTKPKNEFVIITFYVLFLIISITRGNQSTVEPNHLIQSFMIPEPWQSNVDYVAKRIEFPELPKNDLYRLGITADEHLLDNPEKATRKSRSIGKSTYKDIQWFGGISIFSCSYFVKNSEPLPTELPAEQKQYLIAKCKEWGKSESQTKEEFERTLNSYRKSKEYINKGQLDIRILNASSPKTAFEWLVIEETVGKNIFIESIISQFDKTSQLDVLGTVGYRNRSGGRIYFIRDNIAVIVRGNGEFEREVMKIAKKIDAALLKQPLLTYEQLQARRPILHIGPAQKRTEKEVPSLEYSVQAPAGVKAWAMDIKVDSTRNIRNGRIYLEKRPKKVTVESTVVSEELLITKVRKTIEFPKQAKPGEN